MRLLAKGGVIGCEEHEMPPEIRQAMMEQMLAQLVLEKVRSVRRACWGLQQDQSPSSFQLLCSDGLRQNSCVDICVAVGDDFRVKTFGIASTLVAQSPDQIR